MVEGRKKSIKNGIIYTIGPTLIYLGIKKEIIDNQLVNREKISYQQLINILLT